MIFTKIIKILELHIGIIKTNKTLQCHVGITKIMEILEFHMIIKKIMNKFRIQLEIQQNRLNLIIPCQKLKKI